MDAAEDRFLPAFEPRAVEDYDSEGLIALIGAAYAEYPGCVLDLDGIDADLLAPATVAEAVRGRGWVLDDRDGIGACIGMGPDRRGTVELKRLYVAPPLRRRGVGAALVAHVESTAAESGAGRIELWSDTRFHDAHRLYVRLGYRTTGERRKLGDPSDTTELRFVKDLEESTDPSG